MDKTTPIITAESYVTYRNHLEANGYASSIDWARKGEKCPDSLEFWREYAYVVINSGMKNTVARGIYDRVREAVESGKSASSVFGHINKCRGIDYVYHHRSELYEQWKTLDSLPLTPECDEQKLRFLDDLPHIGGVIKYHLAKNLGMDVAKPDRHLVRIAAAHNEDTHQFCRRLSEATGDRVALVDYVIWQCAALGWI